MCLFDLTGEVDVDQVTILGGNVRFRNSGVDSGKEVRRHAKRLVDLSNVCTHLLYHKQNQNNKESARHAQYRLGRIDYGTRKSLLFLFLDINIWKYFKSPKRFQFTNFESDAFRPVHNFHIEDLSKVNDKVLTKWPEKWTNKTERISQQWNVGKQQTSHPRGDLFADCHQALKGFVCKFWLKSDLAMGTYVDRLLYC